MKDLPYRGAAVTVLLVILLLTPPSELFHREGAFADTRADIQTSLAEPIVLNDGLRGDVKAVLPTELGEWRGVNDESWDEQLSQRLQYDQLLVRDFQKDGLFVPVQSMVLTARHAQAFHDPEVCFSVQGGQVSHLSPTSVQVPSDSGFVDIPVGRMLIEYDNASIAAKLVYNLYIVETRDAAPDRTSWIRLTLQGAVPSAVDSYEPLFQDLLGQMVPYLFHGAGDARTTFHWIGQTAGWWVAAIGAVAAFIPVAGEWAWLWRRRGA